jgi:tetratricopeptide (TPR) repeat protein
MVLRKLIVGLLLGAIASGSQQSFAQHRKAPFLEQVIRGVDAITRDQPQRAIAYFAAALMQKKESRLDVLVGLAALSAKKPKLATAKLERAIRKGVNSADVLYWAARAQLARGDVKAALSRVEQAVAIAPKNPTLLVGYALIAKRAKRSNIAREQLARLVVRLPHLRDVRLYPSAKMGAIEQLQRLAPKTTQAKRLVAHLYWRAGAPLAAAPLLLELMRNPKDGDARQLLARVYHALGQTGAAIALARRAVEATPSNAMARATLGELLLSQKKAKQARRHLMLAANGRPNDVDLLAVLAHACFQVQDLRCAKRFVRFARHRRPQHEKALYVGGLIARQEGRHKKALAHFERLIALAPTKVAYLRIAADTAQLAKASKKARTLLLRVAKIVRSNARRARRLRRDTHSFKILSKLTISCGCFSLGPCGATRRGKTCLTPAGFRSWEARWLSFHIDANRGLRSKVRQSQRASKPPRTLITRALAVLDAERLIAGKYLGISVPKRPGSKTNTQVRKGFPMALFYAR